MNVKEALCCSGVNPVEIVGMGFSEGAGQTVNVTGTPGNAENSDTNILTAPVAMVIQLLASDQIPRERIPSLLAERPDVAEAWSSEQRGGGAPRIEFHQQDWIPGFAAFVPDATTPPPASRAFCVLNLGSMLAAVEMGDLPKADLPYLIAESMMHEVMHALEQWAGTEFSEERIEALLDKYRATLTQGAGDER